MKQFVLNTNPDKDGRVRLEGGDYRYLVRVRRLAPGEYFPALLPCGEKTMARICSVDNRTVVAEIAPGENIRPATAALPPIILFQALPKGEKMDLIVRQSAEGALCEIVPFVSEFSSAKISGEGRKFSRWERIIKEARQQSGSTTATAILPPLEIDDLFAYWEQVKTRQPGVLGLLFHHLPLAKISLHEYLEYRPGAVVLAIGPEGGFSPAEAERFLAVGFKPFTLGDTILRTETAALYAQAAVRILLLEKDSWTKK
ncbi:MAG: 16S rRNA (uracil(1498)-N(3))-methyltransferase [Treponema sp.]|jgi:16S rRNA (uracil1498-N3)-methyltransferase|nr:16S rRNA (uracil(1498)-N(3))-methyltransferase [Treponema sp.]